MVKVMTLVSNRSQTDHTMRSKGSVKRVHHVVHSLYLSKLLGKYFFNRPSKLHMHTFSHSALKMACAQN